MAPNEKQKIEIEKTHRDPLLSFNQAVTLDCWDFLGTALKKYEKGGAQRQRAKITYESYYPADHPIWKEGYSIAASGPRAECLGVNLCVCGRPYGAAAAWGL